ncbi:MAG TPA: hypothetical protein GX743_05795 [Actinomycetales bacterium]|nr:hypothetical protein [Actinomycetales bacterium]
MRRWLAALVVALTLPWLLAATAPPEEPSPTPSPTPTYASVTEATVNAWLRERGHEAITGAAGSGYTAEQLNRVQWSAPIQAVTWSESYIEGDLDAAPVRGADAWLAPLVLDGAEVGVLALQLSGGAVAGHREVWNPELGAAIRSAPTDRYVIEGEDVFFHLTGETLRPLGDPARELLAGTISVADFQQFVSARLTPDEVVDPDTPAPPSLRPVIVAAIVLGGILALAGLITWSRRPEGTP